MKKTVALLAALVFSLALTIPSLMWADDGKHMEEGSGGKADKSSHGEYKDKGHAKGKKHDMKDGHDKSDGHKKMEEGSKDGKEKAEARKKEGS
jgi:hypothetical protein